MEFGFDRKVAKSSLFGKTQDLKFWNELKIRGLNLPNLKNIKTEISKKDHYNFFPVDKGRILFFLD